MPPRRNPSVTEKEKYDIKSSTTNFPDGSSHTATTASVVRKTTYNPGSAPQIDQSKDKSSSDNSKAVKKSK